MMVHNNKLMLINKELVYRLQRLSFRIVKYALNLLPDHELVLVKMRECK